MARIHYNALHAPAPQPGTPAALQPEDKYPALLLEYRTFTECQIQSLCTEITQLMENSVIKNSSRTESKVFFSKLCGDYYRYCSEVIHDRNVRVNYEKKVNTRANTTRGWTTVLQGAPPDAPPDAPLN